MPNSALKKHKVYFKKSNLTIQIEEFSSKRNKYFHAYEIDLEKCIHSSELLDYLFQIARKDWCTGELLLDLFEEIEAACKLVFKDNAQGVFCPLGTSTKVDWVKKQILFLSKQ